MFPEVINSVLAGLVTIMAAALSQVLLKRQSAETRTSKEQAEVIAKVLQTKEAASKAAVMEQVMDRVPAGLPTEQFDRLVNEITMRLPTVPAESPEASTAVEALVNNYHEQALSQAKIQFWFSVVAATVGFVWILNAGFGVHTDSAASLFRIVPGVVVDVVAALFFRQAEATRARATELYDRLRRDKQLTESAALVSSIEDVRLRSAVKAQLALHMSGLEPNPIDLTSFLSGDGDRQTAKTVEVALP
jgi:hypothetical protein